MHISKITDLRKTAAEYNPRKISKEELETLKKCLEEYGDLSGIVVNIRTGTMIGGHQRTKTIPEDAVIERTENYQQPTRTGTVAHGYISINGERYAYREVDWPLEKEKAANLAANATGGDWNMAEVQKIINELSEASFDLHLTGFETGELENIIKDCRLEPAVMKKAFEKSAEEMDDFFDEPAEPQYDMTGKYPLTVIFDFEEYRRWNAAKEAAKITNDKKMLLHLIERRPHA